MEPVISMIDYNSSLAPHFRDLNLAWLHKYFYVEALDHQVLNNPEDHIIKRGGAICFAAVDGEIAGTFALLKMENDLFELAKMAVDEKFQGRGVGNAMLAHSLVRATNLGASRVILYSNTILAPAIHLYRKYGFCEVPLDAAVYKRSNIRMEKSLP